LAVQFLLQAKHFYSEGDQYIPSPAKITIKENISQQSQKDRNKFSTKTDDI
jgi:hypothetical protein